MCSSNDNWKQKEALENIACKGTSRKHCLLLDLLPLCIAISEIPGG